MFLEKRLCLLAVELSELEVFNRVISVKHQRTKFLRSFQSLIDHGANIAQLLIKTYVTYCQEVDSNDLIAIETGLKIGSFFNEGGLFNYSVEVLSIVEEVCKRRTRDVTMLRMLLDCYHKYVVYNYVVGLLLIYNLQNLAR